MPKHSISSRETQVGLGNAVAKQVEQTVSVDDLSLVALVSLAAYALYLNHNWFAGIFGFGAVISIVTLFVNAGKNNDLNQ